MSEIISTLQVVVRREQELVAVAIRCGDDAGLIRFAGRHYDALLRLVTPPEEPRRVSVTVAARALLPPELVVHLQGYLGELLDAASIQTDDEREKIRRAGFRDAVENVLDFLARWGHPWVPPASPPASPADG